MLGQALLGAAHAAGTTCAGVDLPDWDLLDTEAARRALEAVAPSVVINCAALTDVDGCETAAGREAAFRVNATLAGGLARLCAASGIRLLHLSTDYVFDGTRAEPYREEDTPNPKSVYGTSKRRGEEAVLEAHPGALVVRTAWLYGPAGRKNFVEAILRLAREREFLEVVDDQRGSPTHAPDLARALLGLARLPATGIVHATNAGSTTWHGFARKILELSGVAREVRAITTTQLGRPAPRPANSVLDCARLAALGIRLRPWEEALGAYLAGRGGGAAPGVQPGPPAPRA
ncbi:MAG: dTDP-4-dehydrorhamnose reductase [Planctomycetes bacterium]|nr:dTDP-4-dehydrorhamnose reductase [Planctomycetota bacterium]